MKEILLKLIENPTVLSAIFLPIFILWITNRNNQKMLELQSFANRQEDVNKLMFKYEDETYSSLVRILFDVQMLHVELSRSDCDTQCIEKALNDFIPKLKDNQAVIAQHQLSLNSVLVDQIYSFYNRISGMVIHLSAMKQENNDSIVRACVAHNANHLAELLINFKKIVYAGRSQDQLGDMPNFSKCCGAMVTKDDIDLYLEKFDPDVVKETQDKKDLERRRTKP